jgi:hypothetical protein
MEQDPELLDASADARRTWDDLVSLQPDVLAANGGVTAVELLELGRRVSAHRQMMDLLADALDTLND